MEPCKTFTGDQYIYDIFLDEFPVNPIEDWDIIGDFYEMDKHEPDTRANLVFFYDADCDESSPEDAKYFIEVAPKVVVKEYGGVDAEAIKKVGEYCDSIMTTFHQYLEGEVYRFEVHRKCQCCGQRSGVIDSCGGFYGGNFRTNGMIEHIGEAVRADLGI